MIILFKERREPRLWEAITPPAGPERRVRTGRVLAMSADIYPPAEFIMLIFPLRFSFSFDIYSSNIGRSDAFSAVATALSYSLCSIRTSWDTETLKNFESFSFALFS